MAFGKVSANTKIKNLQIETFDPLIYEHMDFTATNYFLFLVDFVCKDRKIIDQLKKDIDSVGIKSYCIVSSITLSNVESKQDATKELVTFESDWKKYLNYKGVKAAAIVGFGRTIRVLNKSADIGYFDFLDDLFTKPRYFCGSKYVNGPDTWVYPAAGLEMIYPFKLVGKGDFVCYHTRFFRKQLTRLLSDDFSTKELDMRPINIIDCSEDYKIDEALDALTNADLLALDTETSGFDCYDDTLGTVQMCADGENSYFFVWSTLKNHKRRFTKCLKSAKRLTLANAKFDIRFLFTNGIKNIFPTDDTCLLSHAMNSNRPKGLKPGTWFWCGNFGGYDDALDTIKKKMKVKNYLQIPMSILKEYASDDPAVTWRQQVAMDRWCHEIDKKIPNEKIPEWTIYRFYKEIMMPNLNTIIRAELNGVFFDEKKIIDSQAAIQKIIDDEAKNMAILWSNVLDGNFSEKYPEQQWPVSPAFEFSSTDKLGKLFEKMGWPCIERNKKGVYSTSDPVLQEYERLGMPGIKNLKRYRSFKVAMNTFCVGWSSFIKRHEDGTSRVHPTANAFGVVSMRHAMNDPNFQQIPSAGEIAPYIKKFFTDPPSHEYIEVEDENGTVWNNAEYLNVLTSNRGSIPFEELEEDDVIIEYDKNRTVYDIESCWVY